MIKACFITKIFLARISKIVFLRCKLNQDVNFELLLMLPKIQKAKYGEIKDAKHFFLPLDL